MRRLRLSRTHSNEFMFRGMSVIMSGVRLRHSLGEPAAHQKADF